MAMKNVDSGGIISVSLGGEWGREKNRQAGGQPKVAGIAPGKGDEP